MTHSAKDEQHGYFGTEQAVCVDLAKATGGTVGSTSVPEELMTLAFSSEDVGCVVCSAMLDEGSIYTRWGSGTCPGEHAAMHAQTPYMPRTERDRRRHHS